MKSTHKTRYKDTISMEKFAAEDYMKNGRRLSVTDMFGNYLGWITPEVFKNTARTRTTKDGLLIYVANFIKGSK